MDQIQAGIAGGVLLNLKFSCAGDALHVDSAAGVECIDQQP